MPEPEPEPVPVLASVGRDAPETGPKRSLPMNTAELNRDHVQWLLDQPRGRGMVLSCYADTAVAEGFEARWLQPFKTEARQIRQRLAGDHQAGQEFERNLESIRLALESSQARQSRGMAVFSAAGRGFLLALPSDVPFEDRLVIDEVPYVVPLLEAYLRQRGYLVVLIDTHRGRLYAAGRGGSRLLEELDEAVPRKNRSAGERWGKQQATIERHRKDHILHFLKELEERLERAWDGSTYQGIILLGEREVRAQFRRQLLDRMARHVVHEAPHAWTAAESEIDAVVRAVIDREQTARQQRVRADLARRLGEGCAVTAGPQEVIDALRNGQVADLILGPDPGATASRCTGCRALFAAARASCPYCAAPCRKANLWQEVLGQALAHGIWVDLIRSPSDLDRHGGIAALLMRDEPQWMSHEQENLR
jgi:peptide subunit release factor 1 (eRF1)